MKRMSIAAAVLLSTLAGASADEFSIKLKPGKGSELTQTNCAACHSLDYIKMNSPFLDAKGWTAEVTKMVKVFGADINDADAKEISQYLAEHYSP